MAALVGNDGVLSVDGATVATLRSYSIDTTSDTIETTVMGNDSRTYVKGLSSYTGSADVYWDATHFTSITNGNPTDGNVGDGTVVMVAYPTGTGANWSGNILITGYSVSGTTDGLVEATISFQGSGALTYAAS